MKIRKISPIVGLLLLFFAPQVRAQKSVAAASSAKTPDLKTQFISATETYKTSLQGLVETYEANVRKLAEQNTKLKELYAQGMLAKRELEASDAALAEARAKVEETRRQIATEELAIVEAKRRAAEVVAVYNASRRDGIEPHWTTGNARIDGLIRQQGSRYGVDPFLVFCVMEQESRFNPGVVSLAGAIGLMQLMPATAARFGVANPFDPAQNVQGGTRYLKELLTRFGGRIDLALASYNAGEGAVIKYGQKIPPYRETQNYVRLISARYGRPATPSKTPTATTKRRVK